MKAVSPALSDPVWKFPMDIDFIIVASEAQMPFGGVKRGGSGRFGGKAVIDEFTDLRWITIEGRQLYPF